MEKDRKDRTIYLLYTNNSILAGANNTKIDLIIQEIKLEKVDVMVLDDWKDFLDIQILKENDRYICVSQAYLITFFN